MYAQWIGLVLMLAVACRADQTVSSGARSAGSTLHNLSTVGQGYRSGVANGTSLLIQSGFQRTFVLYPDLDTDGDGVADENDPDNDDDGLWDDIELAGSAFNPTTASNPQAADSDSDGADDRVEAEAGTNPVDPASVLRITGMSIENGMVTVSWQSRGGQLYEVRRAADPQRLESLGTLVLNVLATGGVGPWRETESDAVFPVPVGGIELLKIGVAP